MNKSLRISIKFVKCSLSNMFIVQWFDHLHGRQLIRDQSPSMFFFLILIILFFFFFLHADLTVNKNVFSVLIKGNSRDCNHCSVSSCPNVS